jgi:1,4-dihydroxy-2-naphthoyl-CoA synthase
MAGSSGHIRIEHESGADHGIAWLVIDRPAKRNAITYQMLGEVVDAFQSLSADQSVRVVILTGYRERFAQAPTSQTSPPSPVNNEGCAGARPMTMPGGPR